jgi:bifunctional DNA-binding transcriptional regulator/antitoxin component of YhaV-PrlF toxin-antitoxin module
MDAVRQVIPERKIINVTGKRQITIPLRFFEKLRFGKEVECLLTDDSVVLRPLSNADDGFSMEILRDLVAEGCSGEELLQKFAARRNDIRRAAESLMAEADEIAEGTRSAATAADIFGEA